MKRNVRALIVLLRWAYGQRERGDSQELSLFFEPFRRLCREVRSFCYDEYWENPTALEQNLQECVASYKPDIIFFTTYADQFRPEFLDALKTKCRTIAWFGDDQWRFDDYSRRYALHYSTCVTTDKWAVSKYRALGADVVLSQWAADLATRVQEPLPPDGDYMYDVSFLGSHNAVRDWFVRKLLAQGVKVNCFGHNWPNGSVPNERIAEQFHRTRVNLNLSNSIQQDIRFVLDKPRSFVNWIRNTKRVEQMKARNFEIPLAGGFELSHYAPSLEDYFDIGKEIAIFTSPEECALQIKYYLENALERYQMACRAHKRAVAEHTYLHRIAKILDYVCDKAQ